MLIEWMDFVCQKQLLLLCFQTKTSDLVFHIQMLCPPDISRVSSTVKAVWKNVHREFQPILVKDIYLIGSIFGSSQVYHVV